MSNLYRHHGTLLSPQGECKELTLGTPYQLRPDNRDTPEHLASFAVVFEITVSGESGSVTPSVQTSWDGKHWIDVARGAAVKPGNAGSSLRTMKTAVLGPLVRGVVNVQGAAAFQGTIRLVSSARFRLV